MEVAKKDELFTRKVQNHFKLDSYHIRSEFANSSHAFDQVNKLLYSLPSSSKADESNSTYS